MKTILKSSLVLFTLTQSVFGHKDHASKPTMPAIGIVQGSIVDSVTSKPIEYASVSIYDLDTKELVAGAITDIEGYFSIDKVPMGSFFVLVQFIAYEVFTVENVILNSISGIRQNLGEIRLIPKSIEGLEVSVTEDIPKIEFDFKLI